MKPDPLPVFDPTEIRDAIDRARRAPVPGALSIVATRQGYADGVPVLLVGVAELDALLRAAIRDERQAVARDFVAGAFSPASADDPFRRALRLLEEAVEAAQAVGVGLEHAHQILATVYAKPPGDPAQEIGGVGLCLLTFAAALGLSADAAEEAEVVRCICKLSGDPSHFRERDAAKPYGAQALDAPVFLTDRDPGDEDPER